MDIDANAHFPLDGSRGAEHLDFILMDRRARPQLPNYSGTDVGIVETKKQITPHGVRDSADIR